MSTLSYAFVLCNTKSRSMEKNKIIFLRDFLLRTFLIGIVFAVALFILTVGLRDIWISMATGFFHLEAPQIDALMLSFFLNVRLVLIFLILSPALALHLMQRGKE